MFNVVTHIIYGSDYPTANLYLPQVYNIKLLLDEKAFSENDFIRRMSFEMKKKFDKYWGEVNMLMVIASILDPRCKMKLVEFSFNQIYPGQEGKTHIKRAQELLYSVYGEYVASMNAESSDQSPILPTSQSNYENSMHTQSKVSGWKKYQDEVRRTQSIPALKSDIDVYLEEDVHICELEGTSCFDVLDWWRTNNMKYKILSRMAVEILVIPVSSVASECTFSAGGRVIDPHRASLAPEIVQALICGGDWLRSWSQEG